MDDTAHGATDYDLWASGLENLALHLEGILRRLGSAGEQQAKEESIRRRWPYLVDPETGHLNGHDLCWICSSALVHSGLSLPRFRACRWCLAEDRRRAGGLGLVHLLPVFDWPAAPVRDEARAGALTPQAREAVVTAWSSVSVLGRWRRDSVQLAYGYLDLTEGEVIDLHDWQERLTVGPNRSRACWAAYVDGYLPELRQALREQGVSTGGAR